MVPRASSPARLRPLKLYGHAKPEAQGNLYEADPYCLPGPEPGHAGTPTKARKRAPRKAPSIKDVLKIQKTSSRPSPAAVAAQKMSSNLPASRRDEPKANPSRPTPRVHAPAVVKTMPQITTASVMASAACRQTAAAETIGPIDLIGVQTPTNHAETIDEFEDVVMNFHGTDTDLSQHEQCREPAETDPILTIAAQPDIPKFGIAATCKRSDQRNVSETTGSTVKPSPALAQTRSRTTGHNTVIPDSQSQQVDELLSISNDSVGAGRSGSTRQNASCKRARLGDNDDDDNGTDSEPVFRFNTLSMVRRPERPVLMDRSISDQNTTQRPEAPLPKAWLSSGTLTMSPMHENKENPVAVVRPTNDPSAKTESRLRQPLSRQVVETLKRKHDAIEAGFVTKTGVQGPSCQTKGLGMVVGQGPRGVVVVEGGTDQASNSNGARGRRERQQEFSQDPDLTLVNQSDEDEAHADASGKGRTSGSSLNSDDDDEDSGDDHSQRQDRGVSEHSQAAPFSIEQRSVLDALLAVSRQVVSHLGRTESTLRDIVRDFRTDARTLIDAFETEPSLCITQWTDRAEKTRLESQQMMKQARGQFDTEVDDDQESSKTISLDPDTSHGLIARNHVRSVMQRYA